MNKYEGIDYRFRDNMKKIFKALGILEEKFHNEN